MAIRDHQYGPAAVGICGNLAFQYSTRKGIRQTQQRLSGTGNSEAIRRDEIKRVVLRTVAAMMIAMAFPTILMILGLITPRLWSFIVLGIGLITTINLTRSLQRVQREQRK